MFTHSLLQAKKTSVLGHCVASQCESPLLLALQFCMGIFAFKLGSDSLTHLTPKVSTLVVFIDSVGRCLTVPSHDCKPKSFFAMLLTISHSMVNVLIWQTVARDALNLLADVLGWTFARCKTSTHLPSYLLIIFQLTLL